MHPVGIFFQILNYIILIIGIIIGCEAHFDPSVSWSAVALQREACNGCDQIPVDFLVREKIFVYTTITAMLLMSINLIHVLNVQDSKVTNKMLTIFASLLQFVGGIAMISAALNYARYNEKLAKEVHFIYKGISAVMCIFSAFLGMANLLCCSPNGKIDEENEDISKLPAPLV